MGKGLEQIKSVPSSNNTYSDGWEDVRPGTERQRPNNGQGSTPGLMKIGSELRLDGATRDPSHNSEVNMDTDMYDMGRISLQRRM